MTIYNAPVRDIQFILNDLLKIERFDNLEGFSEVNSELITAIIEEGSKIAREELLPLNKIGDEQGCRLEDGQVRVPDAFHDAYNHYVEGGWGGLTCDPEYGGQGLPGIVSAGIVEMMSSCNMAFTMYPGLTRGAYSAILAHASDDLKARYLPKMATGEWSGTMNLTESHCGTDLGQIRSKAEPAEDGSYTITGQKIFISAGDHDMAENIIHLVLAKVPGGPDGVKGISLFIVPKFLVKEDGSVGERNGVSTGSIEEKMGIHGNSTCVLNYEEAKGWMVGPEHSGLKAMFTMMNEARWGVGMQGLSQSEISYQNAAQYARDRLQGRALTGPQEPDKAADPIIVHPDVRRMLMNQKAFNEGARAFLYYIALKIDIAHRHPEESERQAADEFVTLTTPVAKGYITDKAFEYCVSAQQVFGGHGYITEYGMDQFVRDARISMIYEGTNGIQALDLVGRKLPRHGGQAIRAFGEELKGFIADNADSDDMQAFTRPLAAVAERLEKATMWLVQNGMANPDNAGAAATDYMHLFGITSLAYMWAMMAREALEKQSEGDNYYANKLVTAQYFMDRIVPESASRLALIESGSESVMALDAEAF